MNLEIFYIVKLIFQQDNAVLERRKRLKSVKAEINVVPYIDVMLVLLVIFMITAPLLTQGVKINMPQANAKEIQSKEQTPIIVSVDEQGNYYLNISDKPNTPLPANRLLNRITAELSLAKDNGKTRHVMVKGDQGVNYGRVVNVMVLLQQAGVEEVGLMTTPPDKQVS